MKCINVVGKGYSQFKKRSAIFGLIHVFFYVFPPGLHIVETNDVVKSTRSKYFMPTEKNNI